jgi:thymidylate kinase
MPKLGEYFTGTRYFHMMPCIPKRQALPVIDPHGKKPYNSILSLVKLFYLVLKYWLGYLKYAIAMLSYGTITVFDRYYVDLLVDPLRFRYGGPLWFARIVEKFIPSPNLFFLLDASPDVLQSRKQEVSFEETKRQREAYLDWAKSNPKTVILDATQPIDDIVLQCLEPILLKRR